MARPRTEIDWHQFDKLCRLQCTLAEMAEWFACSPDTIERACKRDRGMGFAAYFAKKRSKGKINLRRAQYRAALGGNPSLLIWLGKQYLGQSDAPVKPTDDPREYLETDPAVASAALPPGAMPSRTIPGTVQDRAGRKAVGQNGDSEA